VTAEDSAAMAADGGSFFFFSVTKQNDGLVGEVVDNYANRLVFCIFF